MRIIPREEWGARHGDGRYWTTLPASEVWLHHSVTVAPDTVPPWTDDYEAIRTIERIGADRFGSVYGFPYTFGITPAGLIFEGHHIAKTGAHTYGHNTIGRAICLVGNYETDEPTELQLDAVAWLLRHGQAQGWWREARLDGGHRDLKATACPGRHAYAAIPRINARATQPIGGGGAAPSTGGAQRRYLQEESTMQLQPGKHGQYRSIPDGAKRVIVGCPHGQMSARIIWHGPGYPSTHDMDTRWPDFDWVAKDAVHNTIHRLRPWRVPIPEKATGFALYWDYPPVEGHYDDYTGEVSFEF